MKEGLIAFETKAASDNHQQNEEDQNGSNVIVSTTNATGHCYMHLLTF